VSAQLAEVLVEVKEVLLDLQSVVELLQQSDLTLGEMLAKVS